MRSWKKLKELRNCFQFLVLEAKGGRQVRVSSVL